MSRLASLFYYSAGVSAKKHIVFHTMFVGKSGANPMTRLEMFWGGIILVGIVLIALGVRDDYDKLDYAMPGDDCIRANRSVIPVPDTSPPQYACGKFLDQLQKE
jgi:hypothetical protein